MLNLFKKSGKKSSISNFATEKLNATELKQVMGGSSINYEASKSNTGNVTAGSGAPNNTNQAPVTAVSGGSGN